MKFARQTVLLILILVCLVMVCGCSGSDKALQADVIDTETETDNGSVNSADFSGRWSGTVLIAEVSNEEFKDLEGIVFPCDLDLSIDDKGAGQADLYIDGELAGPGLEATVVQDRPHLVGELFTSPFEYYGTFSNESGEWALVGSGETNDERDGDILMVFNLTGSVTQATSTDVSEGTDSPAPAISADAPLDQFLVGSWMADELFGEYRVKTFKADGTAIHTMDKPGGPGDDINNWPNGNWTIVESAIGTWTVSGITLITEVEPDFLGLDTEVKIIDEDTIEIWELHTKTLYYRVPE